MKFVIDKLGFEEFTRRWEEAYQTLQRSGTSTNSLTLLAHQDCGPAHYANQDRKWVDHRMGAQMARATEIPPGMGHRSRLSITIRLRAGAEPTPLLNDNRGMLPP